MRPEFKEAPAGVNRAEVRSGGFYLGPRCPELRFSQRHLTGRNFEGRNLALTIREF